MGRRQKLILAYADDLIRKCRVNPDMKLLEKVAIGCGPAIYDPVGAYVAETEYHELMTIKRNFLIRKMALEDGPHLMAAIHEVLAKYGTTDSKKYRAVVYYMLVKHFGREGQYL